MLSGKQHLKITIIIMVPTLSADHCNHCFLCYLVTYSAYPVQCMFFVMAMMLMIINLACAL